jgi:membrane protease YdiL (CAAX protease family)
MALTGARVRVGSGYPTHFPGLLGPAVAAFVVTATQHGRVGLHDLVRHMFSWRVRTVWTIFGVASPLLVLLVVLAVSAVAGLGPRFADLGIMNGLPIMSPLAMWLVLTAWNGFGEETGWRGFALPHLQNLYGPLPGTLILALAWAGWHIPTFFILETYRSLGLVMLPGFVLGLASGAMFLTWLFNRTGSSILAVTLWHGSYNLVTATRAAQGLVAAIVSTMVMVWGIGLAVAEVRARRRAQPSVLL